MVITIRHGAVCTFTRPGVCCNHVEGFTRNVVQVLNEETWSRLAYLERVRFLMVLAFTITIIVFQNRDGYSEVPTPTMHTTYTSMS